MFKDAKFKCNDNKIIFILQNNNKKSILFYVINRILSIIFNLF
jgi:hypothetical protein